MKIQVEIDDEMLGIIDDLQKLVSKKKPELKEHDDYMYWLTDYMRGSIVELYEEWSDD
jgi:hypothetical protein